MYSSILIYLISLQEEGDINMCITFKENEKLRTQIIILNISRPVLPLLFQIRNFTWDFAFLQNMGFGSKTTASMNDKPFLSVIFHIWNIIVYDSNDTASNKWGKKSGTCSLWF